MKAGKVTEELQVYRDRQVGRGHRVVLDLQERKAALVVQAVQEIQADLAAQVSSFTAVFTCRNFVSDIAVFLLKRDANLQPVLATDLVGITGCLFCI